MEQATAIKLDQVSFGYDNNRVLDNITFEVPEGDFLGVIGPNGGGKTTLLKLVLDLLTPTSGEIKIFDRSPREARSLIGYVPQYAEFDREFPVRAWDVVLMGRLSKAPMLGGYRRQDREAAEEAMRRVEVFDLRNQQLGTLSGGQRQRVLIARALASNPRLLLLDEPTASIDTRAERDIYNLLKELNKQTTIILVTHDLGFVSQYVTRVACLNRRLVGHPTARITPEIIEELYHGPVHLIQHHHVLHAEESHD